MKELKANEKKPLCATARSHPKCQLKDNGNFGWHDQKSLRVNSLHAMLGAANCNLAIEGKLHNLNKVRKAVMTIINLLRCYKPVSDSYSYAKHSKQTTSKHD